MRKDSIQEKVGGSDRPYTLLEDKLGALKRRRIWKGKSEGREGTGEDGVGQFGGFGVM